MVYGAWSSLVAAVTVAATEEGLRKASDIFSMNVASFESSIQSRNLTDASLWVASSEVIALLKSYAQNLWTRLVSVDVCDFEKLYGKTFILSSLKYNAALEWYRVVCRNLQVIIPDIGLSEGWGWVNRNTLEPRIIRLLGLCELSAEECFAVFARLPFRRRLIDLVPESNDRDETDSVLSDFFIGKRDGSEFGDFGGG